LANTNEFQLEDVEAFVKKDRLLVRPQKEKETRKRRRRSRRRGRRKGWKITRLRSSPSFGKSRCAMPRREESEENVFKKTSSEKVLQQKDQQNTRKEGEGRMRWGQDSMNTETRHQIK
jgi:hypothetical protein